MSHFSEDNDGGGRELELEDELMHIGIIRRSGRYPWGSGKNPFQRSAAFKAYYESMKQQGMKDTDIAKAIEDYANQGRTGKDRITFKTTDLRAAVSNSTEIVSAQNKAQAVALKAKKLSNREIAETMGLGKSGESTVRGWLKQTEDIKANSIRATADRLKMELETKPYLDVGKGNELWMGISDVKLRTALASLRDEGYEVHSVYVPQLGTDKMTTTKVLTKAGVTKKEVYENRDQIMNVFSTSDDGGHTYTTPSANPTSISSKKVQVKYAEDGGHTMDGVIELRRGVPELDLGAASYAQVRIAVDGTHFLKGMAVYADDLPPGVDIRFNTNKKKTDVSSDLDAMKPMKNDERNRFGATTYPKTYIDKDGNERQSVLNVVGMKGRGNEEGRWNEWSDNLSSQFLSKQSITLAARQLKKAQDAKRKTLDEINALTNPVVKKKMLEEFADSADAAAVHLKAASLPRQKNRVLLPFNSLRPNEIYAPGYNDGERVVLVRHPHGGPFEIPELVVNNKNRTAKRIIGDAIDAVGIHHSVASQLSGADFDGDSVLVIPNDSRAVKSGKPLKGLEGFDPKERYPEVPGMKVMSKKNTQKEMGVVSNLITDMTIKGANPDELARAIRHSMVVIDAEKHRLNYKQSEQDNGIAALKKTYQEGPRGGASTLISRASSTARVNERKYIKGDRGIDPETGRRLFVETGASYVDKDGKTVIKKTTGEAMSFVDNAFDLSSGTPMESVYAQHANAMKSMANAARRESLATTPKIVKASPAAKKVYAEEVRSLESKLKIAQRNAPLERRAQILGNAVAQARIDADPSLDKDGIKKIKYQELEAARQRTGAAKQKVVITDREWAAIQSRAVAPTTLRDILNHADMDQVKKLATPRSRSSLTDGQLARARAMLASGRDMTDVAAALGIPRTTLIDNVNK